MKYINKIIIISTFSFLFITAISGADINSLKSPTGFSDITDGLSIYDLHTKLSIDKYNDTSNNITLKNNSSNGYNISNIENNLYYYIDNQSNTTGVEEKVNIDGEEYLVCIIKEGNQLSDKDKSFCITTLKEFNNLNNFKPLAI